MKAKIIRVEVSGGNTGLFFSSSPDTGLHGAEKTEEELLAKIPTMIRENFAALGQQVIVAPLEGDGIRFIAIPADIARQQLLGPKA